MNLRDKLLVTLLFTTLQLVTGISVTVAQETPFEQLIAKFENGCVFFADFTHETADSYTGETSRQEGTLWVANEEYKVQSNRQTVVVDGETSRVYNETRNRLIVSTYEPEEDDFAPSRFLSGIDSTFAVAGQQTEGENTIIRLKSQDPFAVITGVRITLGPGLVPIEISTVDQVDNRGTTTFRSGSFMREQEGMFKLEYPDDAEIIDMRD